MLRASGVCLLFWICLLNSACASQHGLYRTFADYPGFDAYYSRCEPEAAPPPDRELLVRYRPRFIIAPRSTPPIDFYRDYLPNTQLRHFDRRLDRKIRKRRVTRQLLRQYHRQPGYYLNFNYRRFLKNPPSGPAAVYGRVYRQPVMFRDGNHGPLMRRLTFLKYNLTFPVSGLPQQLNALSRMALTLSLMNPSDWHELDHYTAVYVVLDEELRPFAVMLAQHNHHRSYLIGKHIIMPGDGRLWFEIARRSNELYPAREQLEPRHHRTIRWRLYYEYMLTGNNGPWFRAEDVTYSRAAGGREADYRLDFLSGCDPFYTAKIMLGEPRALFGMYIGRDGPPGADYYTIPGLLPLGKLLTASYFHESQADDIAVVRRHIHLKAKRLDLEPLIHHGAAKLYRDWQMIKYGRGSVPRLRKTIMPKPDWTKPDRKNLDRKNLDRIDGKDPQNSS